MNVDWGHLGEIQKSDKMYNLGRIQRYVGKYDEAEDLFKQSLVIEQKQSTPSNEKMGRRLGELAMLYEEKQEIAKGVPYVKQLFSIPDIYSGKERTAMAAVFYVYSLKLKGTGDSEYAAKLSSRALDMGFDPKILNLK